MEKTNNNKHRIHPLRIALVLVVSGLFLFGATMLVYAQTFRGKILPGVSVGDLVLGGLTPTIAHDRLAEKVAAYEQQPVTIALGSGSLTTNLESLGVTVDVAATVERAYTVGRPIHFFGWFALPVFADTQESIVVAHIDQTTLDAYLRDLETRFSIEPIEPTLTLDDDQPVVQPGRKGKRVTFRDVHDTLQNSVGRLSSVSLNATESVIDPETTETSLLAMQSSLKSMVRGDAILVFGKYRYVVTAKQLASWISYDSNTTKTKSVPTEIRGYSIDTSRSKSFFQKIANDVSIPPKKTFSYVSKYYGEYAFKNAEGRRLNLDKTKQALLLALTKKDRTADVVAEVAPAIRDSQTVKAPRPKGKVISVDVGKQVVFAHENGNLIYWTRVSTGKSPRKTPTGEWKIITKTAKQVMAGPGYYLPNVKWVMPYNGDYTLHTAYWHTNFGQPMSHGCTNMSEKDAKWFYDWADIGTPVVVFDSNAK